MLEKLLEAQLPEDLKVDLEDMHTAIIDYRLFGVESLKKTVDSNLGLIVRRYDEIHFKAECNYFGKYQVQGIGRIVPPAYVIPRG